MAIVNCMKFRPKEGCKGEIFSALSDYVKKYPLDKAINWYILDIDDGEYAHVAIWETVDDFMDVVNRDVRFSDSMRPYVQPYEDGEDFHSFSGPSVDINNF
jgi:hypothetical protein